MKIELMDCERTLLQEIANPGSHQRDVAKTYALALRSCEWDRVDWRRVNAAIMERWSLRGLENVKRLAWSGK